MSHLFNEAKLKPKTHLSVDTQTWIRGKTNSEGYFTLQNKANGKLLTFGTSSQTKLAGLYNHIYNNISSVVEFQRWWVLKSKLFCQVSTYSKEKIKKILTMNDSSTKSDKIVSQFLMSKIDGFLKKNH